MKDFLEKWGQTHSEICANLGYDEDTADELLVDEYFFYEGKWYRTDNTFYSEKEQKIADHLRKNHYLEEIYENLPQEVLNILSSFNVDEDPYFESNRIITELEKIGYSMEYGLDGEPFNLHKIE
jgi:hypothetical protein